MLYKLSTVLLNIERFKNENPVVFDGSEISEHQFMEKIIDFIFQDNFQDTSWTIFDQFDYTTEEKKLNISGFKALRLHWENESSVFQEFFQELLDENINNILENNPNYDGIFLSDSSVVNSQQNDDLRSNDIISWLEANDEKFISDFHNLMFTTEGEKDVFDYLYDIKDYLIKIGNKNNLTFEEKEELFKWTFIGFVKDTVLGTHTENLGDTWSYNLEVNDAKNYLLSMDGDFTNHLTEIGFFNIDDKNEYLEIRQEVMNHLSNVISNNPNYDGIFLSDSSVVNSQQNDDLRSNDIISWLETNDEKFISGFHNLMFTTEGEKDVFDYLYDIKDYLIKIGNRNNLTFEEKEELFKWAFIGFVKDTVLGTHTENLGDTWSYNLEVNDAKNYLLSMDGDFTNHLTEIGFFNIDDKNEYLEIRQEVMNHLSNVISNNPNYDGIFLSDSSVVNSQQNDDLRSNDIISWLEANDEKFISDFHNLMFTTEGEKDVFDYLYDIKDYLIKIGNKNNLTFEEKEELFKWTFIGFVKDTVLGTHTENLGDTWSYNLEVNDAKNYLLSMDGDFTNHLTEIGFFNIDDKKDFTITNFEITDEELHDSKEYIEGNFNFKCDGDYTTGSFTYWSGDTETEIDGLDFEYQEKYDKNDEFSNELLSFVEDNVDTDLFYEPEISELEILTETFVENEEALYIKGEISFQYGDGNDYELSYKFYEDDSIELEDIKPFDDNSDEFYKQENIFSDFLKAHLDIDVFEKNWTINNFEITDEELHDSKEYIEGNFNFKCDGDYTTGSFTYWSGDTETEIDGLDFEYQEKYDKNDEFSNELLSFVEDNVDTDLFGVEEIIYRINDIVINGTGVKAKIISIDEDEEKYEVNVFAANGEPINYNDTWDFSETELLNEISFMIPFDSLQEDNETHETETLSKIDSFNNFPKVKVKFYYPFETKMTEFFVDNKILVKAFEALYLGDHYEDIKDDVKLLSENLPEVANDFELSDFGDILNNLLNNVPGSNLENNEEMLYLNINNKNLSFKISVSALTHEWLEEFFLEQ